ncbi:MAG: diguanylate cyclase, partial [Lachnospiraceae bacterium]|nr:diguanylate cyclase [Lachnospiraceae bacterium]
ARYGGDEFAVLFESNTEENAKLVKSSISDNLRVINERTKLPFDLSVSIGYASTDGDDTLKELIDKADEAMYEAKKASK